MTSSDVAVVVDLMTRWRRGALCHLLLTSRVVAALTGALQRCVVAKVGIKLMILLFWRNDVNMSLSDEVSSSLVISLSNHVTRRPDDHVTRRPDDHVAGLALCLLQLKLGQSASAKQTLQLLNQARAAVRSFMF